MKKTLLFLVLASCAIAFISAQGNERKGQGRAPSGQPPRQQRQDNSRQRGEGRDGRFSRNAQDTAVSGNLAIVRGMIAVKKDDVTYFAGGLDRFVGFIDGLKEGAAVTLEGKAASFPKNENAKFLMVQKMTLNGKEYDLARPRQNVEPKQQSRENNCRMNHRMHRRHHFRDRWHTPYNHNRQYQRPQKMHGGKTR
jgi:Ni/Co efflux regulator RcnB